MTIDSLIVNPESKNNSALVIQFDQKGNAIWADCISGTGRNFSSGSVLDNKGNLYFTGSFRNRFEKDGDALTSSGDQDIFIAKYYNCLNTKAEITGQLSFCPGSATELSVKKSFNNVVWNDTIPGKYSLAVNKPGKYWVSMQDKKGCLLTDTVMIKQNDLPVFSLGNDTSILATDSLLLVAPERYPLHIWQDNSTQLTYVAKTVDGNAGTIDYWHTVIDSLSCNYSDTISITYLKTNDRIKTVNTYYFSSTPEGKEQDSSAYTRVGYENSPLNRVTSQTGPGIAWKTKPVTINYLSNTGSEPGWNVTGDYTYTSFSYSANMLYVIETIDEEGNATREYNDKLGQVVLKKSKLGSDWLRTAYIYDDLGLLRCVVPPEANGPSDTYLCYYYLYDSLKRMIEKKIPGGGTVKMVFV